MCGEISEGNIPRRLFPDPMRAEVRVQVQLPPEATELLRDLHNDRQTLGVGGFFMLICTGIMALNSFRGRRKQP